MYLNFYNLVSEPFDITPDPEFLFASPSHKEAFASIVYGIEMRKGFVAVTGEVGTGKTTILRACLAKIDRELIRPVYVFNPNISFQDLMETIFQELGLTPERPTVHAMVQQFLLFLVEEYKAGRNVVLIIDEAQNTPVETLESLRVLSNLENAQDKLLQIVLVGQPELEEKLNRSELRQLRQRIAVRSRIRPLTLRESREYIRHRLFQVTLEENEVFSPKAVKRIVHHARGIPRTINIICDNALITGYGYQQNPISGRVAAEVISDMEGKPARGRLSRWVLGLAAVVLLVVACLTILLQSTWKPVLFAAPTGRQDSPTARSPQPAPGTTGP